ncbi:hypothetical protein OIU77_027900 [Salix suchowensis]|uniref:Uncharacterized protein n=1 Tax=Salix suchowensis TaxID=1278906 RepID=A0ABQ9BR95_9ROSI|nr:hypothetical protein OIU77_027900 [Salix suchowensis]
MYDMKLDIGKKGKVNGGRNYAHWLLISLTNTIAFENGGSSGAGQFIGRDVGRGVYDPIRVRVVGEAEVLAENLFFLPFLPSLRQSIPFQHSDHL